MIASSSGHSRLGSSAAEARGRGPWQLSGRKERSFRIFARQSASLSVAKWQTPLLVAWATAPPSSSWLTSSPMTALITSGPVMYMELLFLTMKTKSVRAGE